MTLSVASVARLAAAGALSVLLTGCLSLDGLSTGAVSPPKPTLARDPTLLVATTRAPVAEPARDPWFSAQRGQGAAR